MPKIHGAHALEHSALDTPAPIAERRRLPQMTAGMSYDEATSALSPQTEGRSTGGRGGNGAGSVSAGANVESDVIPWSTPETALDRLSQADHIDGGLDATRCSAAALLGGLFLQGRDAVTHGKRQIETLVDMMGGAASHGGGNARGRVAGQAFIAASTTHLAAARGIRTYREAHQFIEAIYQAELAYEAFDNNAARAGVGASAGTVRYFRDRLWGSTDAPQFTSGGQRREVDIGLINNDGNGHYVLTAQGQGQTQDIMYNSWTEDRYGAAYSRAVDGNDRTQTGLQSGDVNRERQAAGHVAAVDGANVSARQQLRVDGLGIADLIRRAKSATTGENQRIHIVELLRRKTRNARVLHRVPLQQLLQLRADPALWPALERLAPEGATQVEESINARHVRVTLQAKSTQTDTIEVYVKTADGHTSGRQALAPGSSVNVDVNVGRLRGINDQTFELQVMKWNQLLSDDEAGTITINGPEFNIPSSFASDWVQLNGHAWR